MTEEQPDTKAATDSDALFRTLIGTAVDGMTVIDDPGIVEVSTPACERLFGHEPVEVLGRNVNMLMPDPYRDEHEAYLGNYPNTVEQLLTVSTYGSGNGFVVNESVADTGQGLSHQVRQKLFQPFATTKVRGMGMALSICRLIVEAHGGRISASPNPNGGTTLRFSLPTEQESSNGV